MARIGCAMAELQAEVSRRTWAAKEDSRIPFESAMDANQSGWVRSKGITGNALPTVFVPVTAQTTSGPQTPAQA
jgi:hypothetical protein